MRTSDDIDESSPLLQFPGGDNNGPEESEDLPDVYKHFCQLIGRRPVDLPADSKFTPPPDSLYRRAAYHRKMQSLTYQFTAALTNTLLLTQVVLGAALTGLGASKSSPVLITVFGALNTIIAGVIAFLKSRGQPMRARMFRDDLDRVVDEIENSATMWLGISNKIHGYDAIDTDGTVTVRSEVARLTRMYDRAVKTSALNDPDFYGTGGPTDAHSATLRDRPLPPGPAALPPAQAPDVVDAPVAVPVAGPSAAVVDPDESPAMKAPEPTPKDDDKDKKDDVKQPDDKGKVPEEAKPTNGATPDQNAVTPVEDALSTVADSSNKPAGADGDQSTAGASKSS